MKISELIKKIRIEHNFSFTDMGNRLGFSRGMIDAIEKERSPVSQKILEAYIRNFPIYKDKLLDSYLEQYLPKDLKESIVRENFELSNESVKKMKVTIYDFNTSGDGRVETDKSEEVEIMVTFETGKDIIKNGFLIKVLGKEAEPYFFENDKLVFMKEKFINWIDYDRKIILVEINGELWLRKLYFENATPYLYAFNDRLYPKIDIAKNSNIIFVGVLSKRLEQDLREMKI